jgi:lactobin A/cerein 7B family class IIb bacteriocin
MQELNCAEVEQVNGGIVPILIAAGLFLIVLGATG